MNTKNNRRRRESNEKIESAFTELLQSRELQRITVTDICKTAAINRSTFYANYSDVYELAEKIARRLEEEVTKLYEYENINKYNSNDFLKLFRHIRERRLLYQTYFKLGYDSKFEIYQYDVNQAEHFFENRHIDYHIEFFKSGLNAVIKKWISEGCRETPEEMEEILLSEYRGRSV